MIGLPNLGNIGDLSKARDIRDLKIWLSQLVDQLGLELCSIDEDNLTDEFKSILQRQDEHIDSGWDTLTLTSAFKNYSSDSSNAPRIRIIDQCVMLDGAVSPTSGTNNIGSGTGEIMFTLPAEFRPERPQRIVCHGSGLNKWLLTVNSNGEVNASRYGVGGEYVTPGTTAWMPFTAVFFIN